MKTKYRVVIVGGGSAGWMTAAYLSKALGEGVDIHLVESFTVSTVGVGEATFSTIRLFFEFLGLREEEWMHHCSASYKLAIRFENWNSQRRHFYHPFQRFDSVAGRNIVEWWLKLHKQLDPFDYACFTIPAICDAKRSPRFLTGQVFDQRLDSHLTASDSERALLLDDLTIQYPYAYHFDAKLLAQFMSGYAKRRGVRHTTDDVQDVQRSANGFISSILTKEHGAIEGDLFVDCTGFQGLLINGAMHEPFISFTESLPCDSAVALQIPNYPEIEGINPYTTATTLSAGWVWNIPLFHRTGAGYVYSSAFLSRESAELELRAHLGKRSDGCKAHHIGMRVGRNRASWVKNCVAIGLSSGFVEPLESTGIFFIQHSIEQLVTHFPGKEIEEESVKSYNQSVLRCIDGVREFLTLHYVACTRNDTPFWNAAKTNLAVPSALQERLKIWKKRLPTNRTINNHYHGFEAYSYSVMLLGLGHRPKCHLPVLDYLNDSAALAAFASVQRQSQHLKATLPPLHQYLLHRYGNQNPTLRDANELLHYSSSAGDPS